MKKLSLFFIIIGMMVMKVSGQITLGQQTITFMNCVSCKNYYEPEVSTIDMVGLIISADTIYENEDLYGIYPQFYEEFPIENLPGVSSIFIKPDDTDILAIVLRKDLNDETKAMYLLTEYGWLQSVDMQEFYFFDRLLLLFRYPVPKQQVLKISEPLRWLLNPYILYGFFVWLFW